VGPDEAVAFKLGIDAAETVRQWVRRDKIDAGQRPGTRYKLAERLEKEGIAASVGSVGDAYDNALMESTIGLLKTELIKPRRPWKTLAEVESAAAEWIDRYNHRRLHGETGHVPPAEYETIYHLTTTEPQASQQPEPPTYPGRFIQGTPQLHRRTEVRHHQCRTYLSPYEKPSGTACTQLFLRHAHHATNSFDLG
jgi:putative transposase